MQSAGRAAPLLTEPGDADRRMWAALDLHDAVQQAAVTLAGDGTVSSDAPAHDGDLELLVEVLTAAERLTAAAVAAAGRLARAGAAERTAGLPLERLLSLQARLTGRDARMLIGAGEALAGLPSIAAAFAAGRLSWGQLRTVVLAGRRVPSADRAAFDAVIAGAAEEGRDGDPDDLLGVVDEAVARLRPELAVEREQRAIEASFIQVQRNFNGGGLLYAELDPEAMAVCCEALDTAADPPTAAQRRGRDERRQQHERREAPDADLGDRRASEDAAGDATDVGGRAAVGEAAGADALAAADRDAGGWGDSDVEDHNEVEDDGPPPVLVTRAQQRAEALRRIAQAFLAQGAGQPWRAKPRLLATVEVRDLGGPDPPPSRSRHRPPESEALEGRAGAMLLWRLAGGGARITPTAAKRLACDAWLVPVVTQGAQVVGVGDAHAPITARLREALAARDGGCRFPACHAPAAWADAHHVIPREHGGATVVENLVLLCRVDHARVHQGGWTLTLDPDTAEVAVTRGRRRFTSQPRLRPPPT